ncbi:outer spore wall protein RRT8 [Achaetomium macrosporum]|uniref:Outer spore wall protein RRT8 n=1 Tax=Achaetomium macrosporum TaxID=79813 RepID=A0AAN7C505_9PEZI|nr:outer spore wall protein RRT8 [Achaetomium macrosporum]
MPSTQAASGGRFSRSPVLLRPVHALVDYATRALISASYPIRGMWYFLRHPEFYPLFISRLLPLSLISFLVYLLLFTFTFLPQFLFLLIFHGRAGALINTTVLVLGEGLVIIQGLFEGFFVDECRVDIFDATLIKHDLTDLIAPHRVLFVEAPTAVRMLGKPTSRAEYQPWSLIQIIELVVFLPLNLVPYVGTPAFIMITGLRLGKLSHHRWFKLRGLNKKEAKRELKARRWEYLWFGTVAMVLELVPILSFFFLLTTTAGAALWVAKMEEQARIRVGRPVTHEDGAHREEEEPDYYDDDL